MIASSFIAYLKIPHSTFSDELIHTIFPGLVLLIV